LEDSGFLLYEALVVGEWCPQLRRNVVLEHSRLNRWSHSLWTAGPFMTKATTQNHAPESLEIPLW